MAQMHRLSMRVFILCSAPIRPSVTHFISVHRMCTNFDKIYKISLVTFLCRLYRQEFHGASESFFLSYALLYTLICFYL